MNPLVLLSLSYISSPLPSPVLAVNEGSSSPPEAVPSTLSDVFDVPTE